jgi:glycogen(starch) synthase
MVTAVTARDSQVGIALFASSFHPHLGGVEELSRRLAMEQRRRGRPTIVVTNRWPTDLPATDVVDGVPVFRERFRVPEPRPRHLAGWLAGTMTTRRRVAAILAAQGTGLVHVQCVSSNGYYALRAARRARLPLVVSLQGELTMDADRVYQRSAMLRRTWRALLDDAGVVTGCSQQVVDEAVQAYGDALRTKIRVVPNGIDVGAVRAAEPEQRSRPYVLGLGRMVPQKGFDLLIDAFAMVAPEHPDVELVLAGDGPERAALERRAHSGPCADRIRFIGGVPHSHAASLFRGSSAFVLPSRHEPQGIVVLEAMAAGTPLLATRVGGVPETVRDGENGLLVDGGSADALAAGLRAMLADPAGARERAGRAAREVERFDWARLADAYDDCYRDAAGGGAA